MAKLKNLEVEGKVEINDKTNILELIYPVGSIYMSVVNKNPKDLFGFGEWEGWCSGRVPVGQYDEDSDFDSPNKCGGEKTHTLTREEMPSHAHGFMLNIQHSDGETTTHESLTSGLIRGGQRRYYGETDLRGSGEAHNNMPPYQVCYMWRRIN